MYIKYINKFDKNGEEKSTFKTDLAFTKILKKFNENVPKIRSQYIKTIKNKIPRVPFSSKRKKMSTIISSSEFPQGYRILIKGGSEIILPACNYFRDGDKIIEITEEKRKDFENKIKNYAELTLRTVIIAYKELSENDISTWETTETRTDGSEVKEVYLIEESGFILLAIVGIMDILKVGVEEAVLNCQKAQISLIMVTGDNLTTAIAIAKSCNIMNNNSGRTKAMLGEVIFFLTYRLLYKDAEE